MMRLLALLFASLWLVACSDDAPECRLRPSGTPGIRILECPGGVAHIAGGSGEASCVLTLEKEGWKRVTCSDGTSVLLDPEGNVHYPGSGAIVGTAMRVGTEGDHAGIRVRAVGTPFETRTDAEGRFALANLPAGIYRVRIEAEGRVPAVRDNVPVVNGAYSLGTIELAVALRLSEQSNAEVIPSPSHDTLLVLEAHPSGNPLWLVHLETWEKTLLSSNAHGPAYRFDGRKVLWTENLTSRSRIYVYDVDSGEKEVLPVEGLEAIFFPDGRAVLVRQQEEFVNRLTVHDLVEKETIALGPWIPRILSELPMGPDGGSVVYLANSQLVLYDHENRETMAVASSMTQFEDVHFHPSGRLVAIRRQDSAQTATLLLVDLSRGTTTILSESLEGRMLFQAPDGSLLWREDGVWTFWDGARRETTTVPFPNVPDEEIAWLPDGSGALHVALPTVRMWRRDDGEVRTISDRALGKPRFTRDGAYMFFESLQEGVQFTLVVRLNDGHRVVIEQTGWEVGPGPSLLVRMGADRFAAYDAKTGKLEEVDVPSVKGLYVHERKLVLAGRPGGSRAFLLGIWDGSTRKLTWLTAGNDPVLSSGGRYLFYRGCPLQGETGGMPCTQLYRVDLDTGVYDHVAGNVDFSKPGDLQERFYRFRVFGTGDEEGLYVARADG